VRRPGDAVVVTPGWGADAVRYYDPSLPLVTSASADRTLVLVDASYKGDVPATVAGVLGSTRLRVTHEQPLGGHVRVLTLEPHA